jgi:hypothetical protein
MKKQWVIDKGVLGNKATVRVGKHLVLLDDFIRAVLQNTDNETIDFNIKDERKAATLKFQTTRIKHESIVRKVRKLVRID